MKARLLLTIFFVVPSVLFCQSGAIRGQVTDARTGDPLVGVNVIVVDSKPGHGAATDMNGMFLMNKISPGKYAVSASYLEYQSVTVQNIQVVAGQTTEVNFAMRKEGEGELEKSGDSVVAQKDSAAVVLPDSVDPQTDRLP